MTDNDAEYSLICRSISSAGSSGVSGPCRPMTKRAPPRFTAIMGATTFPSPATETVFSRSSFRPSTPCRSRSWNSRSVDLEFGPDQLWVGCRQRRSAAGSPRRADRGDHARTCSCSCVGSGSRSDRSSPGSSRGSAAPPRTPRARGLRRALRSQRRLAACRRGRSPPPARRVRRASAPGGTPPEVRSPRVRGERTPAFVSASQMVRSATSVARMPGLNEMGASTRMETRGRP